MNANCIYLKRCRFDDEVLDFCVLREDAGHSGICEGQCDECTLKILVCPECKSNLSYFNDYGQEYQYCGQCNDYSYDENGKVLSKIILRRNDGRR